MGYVGYVCILEARASRTLKQIFKTCDQFHDFQMEFSFVTRPKTLSEGLPLKDSSQGVIPKILNQIFIYFFNNFLILDTI